jgi:hypothetical protein
MALPAACNRWSSPWVFHHRRVFLFTQNYTTSDRTGIADVGQSTGMAPSSGSLA